MVSKTIVGSAYRGFESLPLRMSIAVPCAACAGGRGALPRLVRSACRVAIAGAVAASAFVMAARGQSAPLAYEVVYRPSGLEYRVLRSPHFDIIFEGDAEALARETAAVLESELPRAQARFPGGHALRMPVVLDGFSDRAAGLLSPVPFRQEISAVAIKGSRLSARHESWIWAVAPHEVVHAAHAQLGHNRSVVGIVRRVAPDLARALQLWVPPGVAEGVAVYHESHLQPGAGRLNHPLFQMHFRAAMASRRPWTLAQLLEVPAFALPPDRYYVGGANLYRYFAGTGVMRRAARLHDKMPFLGFGMELWAATGEFPARTGRRFRKEMRAAEQARQRSLGSITQAAAVASGPGHIYRRPRWLDESTLIVHASGDDLPRGLYKIRAEGGRPTRLSLQSLPEDYHYSLSEDRQAVIFSRYVRSRLSHTRFVADAFRLDLETGSVDRLTRGARIHAPLRFEDGLWALRNTGQFNEWVSVSSAGAIVPVAATERTTFVQLARRPGSGDVAVLARKDGIQGLYRARWGEKPILEPWLFLEDASIFDISWSRSGRHLLLSADLGGVVNVYALDVAKDVLVKLTNVPYGAFEGVLSPDGRHLAFVEARHEGADIKIVPFAPEEGRRVDKSERLELSGAPRLDTPTQAPTMEGGVIERYRARRRMAPRIFFPVARYPMRAAQGDDVRLGIGVGAGLQGGDPLQRVAYGIEGMYQAGRLWGEATARSAIWPVRTSVTAFDRLFTVATSTGGSASGTRLLGREELGVQLDLRLPLVLRDNVRRTTLVLGAGVTALGERHFDAAGASIGVRSADGTSHGLFNSHVGLVTAVSLAHGVRYNRADLWPAAGMVLTVSGLTDLWAEGQKYRRSVLARFSLYRAIVPRWNLALRARASLLAQNRGGIFSLRRLLPRGSEGAFPGHGLLYGGDVEAVLPLLHVDNGFLVVPLYVKALYVYGFAETMRRARRHGHSWRQLSAVGGGLGLQLRLYYQFDLDLRLGLALDRDNRRVTFR